MKTEKLSGVDAFVVFDIESAEQSAGITRLAPKVLVDGASWLARTETYRYASFERQVGGASAGINVGRDAPRDEVVSAFVSEVEPWVASGRFRSLPGKGLHVPDLAPLRAADPRPSLVWSDFPAVTAAGIVAATEAACGGPGSLDGRTVAIEGVDVAGMGLFEQLAAAGAVVTTISTAKGTVTVPGGGPSGGPGGGGGSSRGFDAEVVGPALAEASAAAVESLAQGSAGSGEVGKASWVFAAPVDVLLVGSKAGVLDHVGAASVQASTVVPWGSIPVTAKGLAVLGRAGVQVLPDFVTTAGTVLVEEGDSVDVASRRAAEAIAAVIGEVLGAEDGALLAACRRAEAFLATWMDPLPFGRPLA